MELIVLGSESAGNGYILKGTHTALMIECGVSFKQVLRSMEFNPGMISGCLISHSHGDHSRNVKDVLYHGIPVYCHKTTAEELKIDSHPVCMPFNSPKIITVGDFTVRPFELKHDVVCYGFLIRYKSEQVVFITDTHYTEYIFPGVNHILVEANYSDKIVSERFYAGSITSAQIERTYRSHMSIETATAMIRANLSPQLRTVVLLHLSAGNSDAGAFQRIISEASGVPCHVADSGLRIKLSSTPY